MSEVKKTAEASADKAKKKQVKKGRLFFSLFIAVAACICFYNLGGRAELRDVEVAIDKNNLKAEVMDHVRGKQSDIRQTKDVYEKIEKSHSVNTELRYLENAIDNLPPRCPETKGWEGNKKYLHLGGCKPGEAFMLVLFEEQDEEEYEAMLFFYGKGSDGRVTKDIDRLLMSPYHPFIEPYEIGKLNLASLVSTPDTTPADYKLRGRVRFLYGGEGDVLRLRRKAK